MSVLRAVLIGVGGRGMSHAEALHQAPNIEFVGICDLVEAVGRPAAEKYGVDYIPSTAELWARDDVDAVGICVTTRLHYSLAMEVIERVKHLLTEKPMAAGITEARRMREQAEAKGLRAVISYQLRFGPLFRRLKDICVSIDPLQVMMARQRGMLIEKYLSPAPFDGIMDFVSHDIDMVPYLAGRSPVAVSAVTRRDTWSAAGAVDVVSALIELGEGDDRCAGIISSSMNGDGIPQRLDVVGKSGRAVVEGDTIRFTSDMDPAARGVPQDPWALQMQSPPRDFTIDMYRHWAACCLDPSLDIAPAATYREAYEALMLQLAIVEAGDSRQRIDLADYAASMA